MKPTQTDASTFVKSPLVVRVIPIGLPTSGSPGAESACEMEHREVSFDAFLPAGEDATEAIQPGVGALNYRAAGTEAGLVFDRLGFLAAAADVGGEGELLAEVA